jgi:hypothetical protein
MIKEEATQHIIDMVNEFGPIKTTELIPKFVSTFGVYDDIIELIDLLVLHGNIVELGYVLPKMSYRYKTLLFPANTELFVDNRDQKGTD